MNGRVQFSAPRLTQTNKLILILAGIGFVLQALLTAVGAFNLSSILGLSSAGLSRGMIFQFITYPFVDSQFMGVLFNGLVLWFIGSDLETSWGAKVYRRFLAVNVIVVGLIYVLVSFSLFAFSSHSSVLIGLTGLNYALLMSYALLYPDREMLLMMLFPVKARYFCIILAAIQFYFALMSSGASSWAHLLSMGVAFVLVKYQTRPVIKKLINPSPSKPKSKAKLSIVKDDEKPPKYWQ
jgi:membrane associated rhomboid family serine protease